MLHSEDEGGRILAAVADASDDAIAVTDGEGVVRAWNRGAARLFGYSADEMLGRPFNLLVSDVHGDELATLFHQVRGGGAIRHRELVCRTKSATAVDISLSISPVRDALGDVVGAASVARDVTGRRQDERTLRTTESRWRSVAESAVDGIVVIDAGGLIEAFNPAAERLFGYPESEVVGRNVSLLMPQPYRDEHDGYLARYLREGGARVIGVGREVTGQHRNGRTFPLHLSVGEIAGDGERKFTGILHDLSARVRMEEQLREQASLARLGEMAAVIAHEVKNPLAGVRGAIQVIGSRLPQDGPDARIVNDIVARVDSLTELVKDLLLFARPPRPKPVPTEIAPLVALTADLLATDPALGKTTIRVAGFAPPVPVDAGLLRIVFLNLLMNSAHAMKGQGVVDVSVRASHGVCSVSIRDHGPGMPADVLEKAFTPFYTTKSRGTGLGLPTARRIVEAHRGSIRIDCPGDGGTIVTIDLPLDPALHLAAS